MVFCFCFGEISDRVNFFFLRTKYLRTKAFKRYLEHAKNITRLCKTRQSLFSKSNQVKSQKTEEYLQQMQSKSID